jgi:hypothetical protein
MSIEVRDITDIHLQTPAKGDSITLLPTDFENLARSNEFHSNTISFVKFAKDKLKLEYLTEPETLLEQRSSDWFAPTMLLTNQLITDHPLIVSTICGVISNYLYALFKGRDAPEVHLTLVCERRKGSSHVRIDYKGDVEGLSKLPEVVRASIERENS